MILMASLPTSWAVVGCALIAVTLIAVVLFVLKAREVATLKKEVLELRDTMRMMRYEEANLSRMLHTADKYPEPTAQDETPEQEEPADEAEEEIAEIAEMPETAETPEETESTEEPEETEAPEESEEPETPEEPEESEETESSKSSEPTSEPELPEPPQVKEPPRKQAINERRPAIPTDLFAAWFEENEQVQEEAPAEAAPVATEPSEKSEISENPEPTDSSETSVSLESSKSPESSESSKSSDSSNSPEPPAAEAQEAATPVALSKEDERFCRKLERIVNSRMKNPNLNIDVIAAQFGIGRTNFYRKVRELMGVSPNDYLRKCRMERAAELLRDSELTIADVCAQVGIPDAQYFSRVFKSHFGIPPSAYREQKSNG